MNGIIMRKIAALTLAATSLLGTGGAVGTIAASNASASTHDYEHHEARGGYRTYASCLANFNGAKRTIRAHRGWVEGSDGTCAQHWGTRNYHYGTIYYTAPSKAYSGDTPWMQAE